MTYAALSNFGEPIAVFIAAPKGVLATYPGGLSRAGNIIQFAAVIRVKRHGPGSNRGPLYKPVTVANANFPRYSQCAMAMGGLNLCLALVEALAVKRTPVAFSTRHRTQSEAPLSGLPCPYNHI